MSRESKPELPKGHAHEMNASNPRGIPAVAHFPAGDEKEMLKKYERSRNVYENKQISGKMPGKKSDIYVLDSDIYV